MRKLDSEGVRHTFLEFFEQNDHLRIGGSEVLAKGDPTLLFVNSGMAPLKAYFTGDALPPHRDLTNVQACIRTKDIDDVGDRHHMTFFEMLGSWSIGGYFKRRAIELAFELLTQRFGFTVDQLYVTVFEGDASTGLPADEESAAAWEAVGMPRNHIVPQPAADNFWGPAGATGPCGPCTEVFLDSGDAYGPAWRPGAEFDTKRRYIEIWNAGVFMQFDKAADGALSPLPFTSVDTGSGLERVTMALNDLENVYETDLVLPMVHAAQDLFGESGGEILQRHRVVADHLRASCLIMSEGVRPGNEGAGYIPRRLIRKCLTTSLHHGLDRASFSPVVEAVVDRLGSNYPRLERERDELLRAVDEECREFDGVVRRGLDRLDNLLGTKARLSGEDAFQLFATYGLPFEITREIAQERGIDVQVEDYSAQFRLHQERSRAGARRGAPDTRAGSAVEDVPATTFLGYTDLLTEATVLALLRDGERVQRVGAGEEVEVVLDRSTFYAEGGGQVGDTGTVRGTDVHGCVQDTVALEGKQYLHRTKVEHGALSVGDALVLTVDGDRRAAVAANHSATHLLNAALRQVLGPHVRQAGSLVEPGRLRFDFTHPRALADDELRAVERLLNEWVLADYDREVEELAREEAVARGALSLPEETYGETVRVVSFDGVSKELCGGTHVDHTSFIGALRIRSEQSVASGVRRIVAVTRHEALRVIEEQDRLLREVAATLKAGKGDVLGAVQRLRAGSAAGAAPAAPVRLDLDDALTDLEVNSVALTLGEVADEDVSLRATAQNLSSRRDRVVALWSAGDRPVLVVAVPDRLRPSVSAADLVRGVMTRLGGSGGGSPSLAQGGGGTLSSGQSPRELLLELLS